MSVTYEQAREIVRNHFRPDWTHGTFCLDDRNIVENDDFYVFEVGAREFLVGGDESYEVIGGIPIIYKEDGSIGALPSVAIAVDDSIRREANPNPTISLS